MSRWVVRRRRVWWEELGDERRLNLRDFFSLALGGKAPFVSFVGRLSTYCLSVV